MNEREEHESHMKTPETFHLELPPGHPGLRPFSALLAGIGETQRILVDLEPTLRRIRNNEALGVDEVAVLMVQINALGANSIHILSCLQPLQAGLHDCFTP